MEKMTKGKWQLFATLTAAIVAAGFAPVPHELIYMLQEMKPLEEPEQLTPGARRCSSRERSWRRGGKP